MKNNNVYALVEQFYQQHASAETLVSRSVLEKYLRRLAWRGQDDAALKKTWKMLGVILSYAEELHLETLGMLTPYDYQEVFYRYAQEDKDFQLNEASILQFLEKIKDFYHFFAKYTPDEDWDWYLKMVRDALYENNGKFYLPPRRQKDEFYSSLEHMEVLSEDDMNKLNYMLDGLLKRIDVFYRNETYKFDLDRAITMFAGPDYEDLLSDDTQEEAQMAFWNGFWDYFLFDYHLSETDAVPLNYYYQQEKDKLSPSEQDILRDLLRSQFTIFTIDDIFDEFIACRNLLTDEVFDLPIPDIDIPLEGDNLFFGHVHSHGVMLINYVTSVPASPKLQKRIKEVLLQQFAGFQLQMPHATIKDFLAREAGAVRHTLQILSGFAQLNVVPVRDEMKATPAAKLTNPDDLEAAAFLQELARKAGYTVYETKLLGRLFADYLQAVKKKLPADKLYLILTACLLKFSQINGTNLSNYQEMYQLLGVSQKVIQHYMQDIDKRLGCQRYDPRYLTEYGFIQALYSDSY